ncbi:MAG: gamma-glutamylcyclotransferase [Candidatus Dadabacteria bacterium]|nr:MAG: gamma-glutamylcyclotransferase [Candidatus Dadabacteria bacterium]
MLRLFVYGSLKRGQRYHRRYCRGAISVQEGIVRGRLYELPSGFPVLEVPAADILAPGTADPLADVATQARLASQVTDATAIRPLGPHCGSWGYVRGEILTFADPAARLRALDRFEEFSPGRPSPYRRVLVPAYAGPRCILAWTYVEGTGRRPAGRWLPAGVWPAASPTARTGARHRLAGLIAPKV